MILLIDNYDSFTYNLYQLMAKSGRSIVVKRNDAVTLEDIGRIAPEAIVLSPGPGNPDQAGICLDVIREFSGVIPILGVCLGHQAIGQAFGATIVNAGEIVHGKQAKIFHNRSRLYSQLPQPFLAGRYHSLMISQEGFPTCLRIEAENSQGLIMGIRHREHATFGVQFHPESILTPLGFRLMENFFACLEEVAHAA